MNPYIGDQAVKDYCTDQIIPTYAEALKPLDADYPVWSARAIYDHACGMSWDASCKKHLAECREAQGFPAPPPPVIVPIGRVRLLDGAFYDDRGPFNPIGASFFPAAWGWKFDRTRTLENADYISPYFDYCRIWGQVAGGPWVDRTTSPDWPDYEQVMGETIDALYDKGMRTQVTILAGAGAEGAETPERRRRLIDQTLAYVRDREAKVFLLEVANEGVNLDVDEMRALARNLAGRTSIPVAITSISQSSPELYEGMRDVVDVSIVHYDRDSSKADGYDRPTRQPWGYPSEYYPDGTGHVPAQAIDNEGIGPYSSVAEDKDPLRNITRRVVAWICGAPASLWHAGPGIYFGGQGASKSGSPANFWEVPGAEETLQGFKVLRQLVPQGISGWSRANNAWPNYPWNMKTGVGDGMFSSGIGCVRAYATMNTEQVVCVPFGIRDHVTLEERRRMTWKVHSLLDGHLIQEGQGTLILQQGDGEAQLILGQFI